MGGDGKLHVVVGEGEGLFELLKLFLYVGQVVGVATVEKGEAKHSAYAHIFHGLSLLRQKEIHIAETGGARFYHLEAAQFGAPIDDFLVEVFLVGPYLGVEPLLQGQVVAVAAEKRHGDVGVHVHESGQGCHSGGVDNLAAGVFDVWGYFGNAVAGDKNVGWFVVQKNVFYQYVHRILLFLET